MKQRSYKPELMDGPLNDPGLLYENLDELRLINRFTGAYSKMFSIIKHLLAESKVNATILDVAAGAGDFLHYVLKRKDELACPVRLIGLDLEPHAKEYAFRQYPDLASQAEWIVDDYRNLDQYNIKPDIITCSLFCHHLKDEDVVNLMRFVKANAQKGFIINDLVRHPFAYHSIRLLTRLFSRSQYTKHDAPLSVLRSFKKKELESFLHLATVDRYAIIRTIFFRYIITASGAEKTAIKNKSTKNV
jgi:ubiquinone/menaquinone biosynthesis C-methylase UbiE